MNVSRRTGLIALVSGAAAATGHAPFSVWPLALLGFAGLTWAVVRDIRPAFAGWLGGVGYFALALHWIVQPFLVDVARHGWMAPFALVFLSAGLALFWGAAGWISGRTRVPALGWVAALAICELARGYVLTGFPWALPAYIWSETPLRLLASYMGPYGLTFLTLLLAAFPFVFARATYAAFGAAAFLGAFWLLGDLLQQQPLASQIGKVRLVQPNAPQHQKWDPQYAHIFVERQLEYTSAPQDDVDLIIWPETAIPYRLDYAAPALDRIAEAAQGTPVVLGLNRTSDGRYYNALVSVPSDGVPDQVYDKTHLVPFGEYIPFGQLARLVGLRSFAARDGYGFSKGSGIQMIETPLGQALPLICYEAIFPQQIHASPARPDYLLQITNDAWFGTFSGPYQHLQQARFRAAEQGLPLVRAANTGVSAVIDARGNIIGQIALGEAGYLDVILPGPDSATFYSKTGDWLAGIFLILILIALFLGNDATPLQTSRVPRNRD